MRARFFSNISRMPLAWLLGILLLMPLAQTAAAWHLISHIHPTQAAESPDQPTAVLADFCDLCLTASATTGGLLPTAQVVNVATAFPSESPPSQAGKAPTQSQWAPYASRAPPFARN